MFSRALHWLYVFPRLALVTCFFFPRLTLVTCFPPLGIVLPHSTLVTCFPTLVSNTSYMLSNTSYMLPHAWHFPELGIYMFSRALCRRLALATNFPFLATGCTFVALGVISISFAWFFGSFASVYLGWPDGINLGLVSDVTIIERRAGQTVAF